MVHRIDTRDKLIIRAISINLFHMSKIEWRHFVMLATIRSTGSVSAAARALGLTQSAASHQVKEAERRLGIALLTRRGRKITLTQAGEILANTAATCAPLLMEAETTAQELGHGDAPRLRLAFGSQDGMGWVADLFAHLRARADPVRLDLIYASDERPPQLLRQNRAEMAIEIGDIGLADLRRELIAEDELVCLIPRDHQLATRKSIAANDIAGEIYFAHALTPQRGFECEAFFRPAQRMPSHVAHIESLAGIITLVGAGKGVSIQPRASIQAAQIAAPIKALPLAPLRLYLPWYVHANMACLAAHGEDLVRDVAALLRPHFAPPA